MYYDRETQSKYIKYTLITTGIAILSITIIAIILNLFSHGQQSISPTENSISYKVVSVTDGDTINIDYNGKTTPIRLIGVDTPETVDPRTEVQCYGPEASNYLESLLSGKYVTIESDPTQDNSDKYGRLLRYVYLNHNDVGTMVIANGYGKEYTYNLPYENQSNYKTAESLAKQNSKGLWSPNACSTDSQAEQAEQAEQPEQPATPQPEPAQPQTVQCLIKGNINNKGVKIYHMPGQQYYEKTIITESKGERWFCTVDEAKAAGWRKSKV